MTYGEMEIGIPNASCHPAPVGPFRKELIELWHDVLRPAKGQIRALDGLRAMAIALVVATHTSSEFQAAGGSPNVFTRFPLVVGGWVGVDLFFVLSGFFIGGQLWKEHQRLSVSVGKFILRRGLRIWPLYFFVVAIVLAAGLRRSGAPVWPDLVFLSNYLGERILPGGWSLSTEEQFYICVPLLVFFGSRVGWSLRKFRYLIVALIVAECLVRAVIWSRHAGIKAVDPELEVRILYMPFHTHCDGLLMGLLVSNFFADGATQQLFSHRLLPLVFPAVVVVATCLRWFNHAVFGYTALALVFGALVATCAARGARWVRFFEGRSLHVLARLSFGIYLNYRFLLPWLARNIHRVSIGAAEQFALLYALVLVSASAIALLTLGLVERPFLRLRSRLLANRGEPGKPSWGGVP